MSVSTMSAASTVSPDFMLRSSVRPDFRLRMRTRLNAWPLPGLTNSFSTIDVRVAVEHDLEPGAEFVGAVAGHGRSPVVGPRAWSGTMRPAATKPRMIPVSPPVPSAPAWQRALQEAVTDPAELLALLGLGPQWLEPARAAARRFPLRVPRGFVARMRRGDPRDPLLLQVLPLGDGTRRRAWLRDRPGGRPRGPGRPRRAAEVPRPRAAGHHRRLRGELPLLLPPPLSLRRGERVARRRSSRRSTLIAPRPEHQRGHPEWRRPADPR